MTGAAHQSLHPVGFIGSLGLKDIALVLPTAASSHTPMPLAHLLHEHLLTGMAEGRADMDWAAMAMSVREAAGHPARNYSPIHEAEGWRPTPTLFSQRGVVPHNWPMPPSMLSSTPVT
jgi:hypothetical protein